MTRRFPELLRYLLISLVALAVDLLLFSVSLRALHLPWMAAATLGFGAGVVIAYGLSIHFVFRKRTLRHLPRSEFALFSLIGIAGLGITQFVLWVGIEKLAVNPELSKLAAAGLTFFFNFGLRKIALFHHDATRA